MTDFGKSNSYFCFYKYREVKKLKGVVILKTVLWKKINAMKSHLRQKDLAEKLGMRPQRLSNLANCSGPEATYEEIEKLSCFFWATEAELFSPYKEKEK